MNIGISFRAIGADLPEMMEEAAERAQHQFPVLTEIANKVLRREKRFFDTRGAATGRYWSPLKGSTVKRKDRHKSEPLVDTGMLKRSVSERGARYQVLIVTDSQFVLGTNHPAAKFHQDGTRRMPARVFLIIPEKHRREYINDIQNFIFHGERP